MYRLEIIDFDKDLEGNECGVMFDFDNIEELANMLIVLTLREKEQCVYKIWKLQRD